MSKLYFFVVLPLVILNIVLWVFFPPQTLKSDIEWCRDNGGRWISSAYNQHCQFLPK